MFGFFCYFSISSSVIMVLIMKGGDVMFEGDLNIFFHHQYVSRLFSLIIL